MFKEKQYYYLISYSFDKGIGNSQLKLNYRLKKLSDIQKVQEEIAEINGLSRVCISNFIRMKGE